ncbi:MAG: zinc ABC transporter substrate-binding protein [Lentisphaeria bacterium]|nr:zinc ABC transporter substrate-binding protein [Lentisphaeria bacterium]
MTSFRKILTALFLAFGPLLSAGEKIPVCAGLPPVARIVEAVGGDAVTVSSMLPEGRSPHDYAPGPRELRKALRSRLFFTTNMPYEERITRALKGKVPVTDISATIHRVPLEGDDHHHHGHHHHGHHHDHDGCSADSGDPHVWLSPVNCAVMARNAARELGKIAPDKKGIFYVRAEDFARRMDLLHKDMQKRLAPFKGRSFFVHHPAFGYFARLYGLRQQAVELGGRETTPARLAQVVKQARQAKVKVIFVQKQFNPASGRALADAIRGEVMELDPLAADVEKNLEAVCAALIKGFGR